MSDSIAKKLADIQSRLHVPKSQHNKFGGYNYRSCEDICNALKPLLAEHGLALNMSDDIVQVADRVYVKATVHLSDGIGLLSATGWAREEETKKGMDGSQITGAASSYARKYALNGLFAIDDSKDSDATNTHGKAAKKSKPESAENTKWVASWVAEVSDCTTLDGLKMMRGFLDDKKSDLTDAQFKKCVELGKTKVKELQTRDEVPA